jgi:hypothetical protein
MEQVVAALNATLSADNKVRSAAEEALSTQSRGAQWPLGLLSIIGEARFPAETRLAAALALKRATRQHWHYDEPSQGPSPYPEEVKAAGAWGRARAHPPRPLCPSPPRHPLTPARTRARALAPTPPPARHA